FPNEPGFHFGLVGDEFTSTRKDLEPPATDAEGKTTIALNLTDLPDVTKPLAVTVQVSVFEPSGRAVIESVTRPVGQPQLAIGLRSPAGDDAIPEGQPANAELIALDADAKRSGSQGLRWELLRENWQYSWYSVNGSWRHRTQPRDQPMETGPLDIGSNAMAALSRNLPARRHRLELPEP